MAKYPGACISYATWYRATYPRPLNDAFRTYGELIEHAAAQLIVDAPLRGTEVFAVVHFQSPLTEARTQLLQRFKASDDDMPAHRETQTDPEPPPAQHVEFRMQCGKTISVPIHDGEWPEDY
jgi:hypothetical protein